MMRYALQKILRMPKDRVAVCALLLIVVAAACSSGPETDKKKFTGLADDAVALKASLAAGATYQQFTKSLQKFSSDIALLRSRTATREEKDLLDAYADLLAIYQDGVVLWRYKLEFAPFGFVPKDRIYVGQDVDPIVFKYRFVTESHLYQPTQQYWKSIPDDSIRIIWSNADSQIKIIENMTRYQG
jgi:hypothetical protein